MTWAEKIIAAHEAVTDRVRRYYHMKGDRYFVWQEDGSNDFLASGKHAERAVTGTTDLYTKRENDPWVERFEQALDEAEDIAWYRTSVQYEQDSGYIHYEWAWEVY